VVAAWTADRKALTIAVVNPTAESREVTVDIKDAGRTGSGKLWQIGGSDPNAYNEPGKAAKVMIEERLLTGTVNELGAAPYSISLYELPGR
jgi:alpha-N-arabinofuranosidase